MARKTQPDDVDINIVRHLSVLPRARNAAIAADLGVSEETVRRRVNWLVNERHLEFGIKVDPRLFGFAETVVLTITPDPSQDLEVAVDFMANLSGVTSVYRVLGDDGIKVIAEVSCVNVGDLNGLLGIIMMNERVQSVTMKRIFDPQYRASGLPEVR